MRATHLIVTRPQTASRSSWLPSSQRGAASHAQSVANPTDAAAAHGHEFSRVHVSPSPRGSPQARLTVGRPGDAFEREADLVADQVMASPDEQPIPHSQGTSSASGEETAERGAEQFAALLLEEDDLEGSAGDQAPAKQSVETSGESSVQAREMPGQTPTVSTQEEASFNTLRGGGAPLPAASRAFFEPRFGHDFGRVRIHTGSGADRMAQAFHARAFTLASDVVFGSGQYQPAMPAGQWLIAHELTHVLQQQEGLSRGSPGSVPVSHARRNQIQGGFFGTLWSGIKKGAAAVAGAAKWAAGKAWQGISWTAGKMWKVAKAVGRWGWDVLKSGAALAWSYVVNTPGRIWRLIKHLGSGTAGVASALWQGLKLAFRLDFKGLGKLLLDGLVSGVAWVLRLVGKAADVAGVGEIVDLLSQIIKVNTRSLSSGESGEADKVFKKSIPFWKVRIDEHSLISKIGAWLKGSSGMGVTLFHTVNFNRKITAAPGSLDMRWLAHELTHVSQYENAGAQYIGEAVHAQATAGYDYHGPNALWRPSTHVAPNTLGRHFRQFNREQQADIAADYYYSLYHNVQPDHGFPLTPTDYEPVIEELRKGHL